MKKPTTTKKNEKKAPKKDTKEKTLRVKLDEDMLKQVSGGIRWKTSQNEQ